MVGSNKVEPLLRHENELKKMTFSVLGGAQICKHVWLINGARNGPKRGKCYSPLKTNALVASRPNVDDSKLLEFLPLLLEWSGGGGAWW